MSEIIKNWLYRKCCGTREIAIITENTLSDFSTCVIKIIDYILFSHYIKK